MSKTRPSGRCAKTVRKFICAFNSCFSTFQSLYNSESHIGELIMTYPEASRILLSSTP